MAKFDSLRAAVPWERLSSLFAVVSLGTYDYDPEADLWRRRPGSLPDK